MADKQLSSSLSGGAITSYQKGGITTEEALLSRSEIIVELTNDTTTKQSINFAPRADTPAYVEGKVYYDNDRGSLKVQGPFANTEVEVGHGMHMHVKNETASTITKGQVVRQVGVAATGEVLIELAIADTFDNARILGMVEADILAGATGGVKTFGEVVGVDTQGLPLGVPTYLSDTVAGALTATPPEIITRVGGVTKVDLSGNFYVFPINNKTLPQIYGGMQGQVTPLHNVTAVPQDLNSYVTESSLVVGTNLSNGELTITNDGGYRANAVMTYSFPTSTSTRTITLEFFDAVNNAVIFEFPRNIPRDATVDALDFNYPFEGLIANNTRYKLRIKSDVAIDVTITAISFDIQSVNIR